MTKDFCIQLSEVFTSYHAPSICELPSGDLLACCFAGKTSMEGDPNQVTLGSRFQRETGQWSEPEIWVDVPHRASGNPRVFVGPKPDEIWLIAPVAYGEWCGGTTRLFMKRSYDEGRTWKDLELLVENKGILGKNKPYIKNNLCILPVEQEEMWSPRFLRSEDFGETWELFGDLGKQAGVRILQPTIVELRDGTLMSYMRSQENRIYESHSSDQGRTWSEAQPTILPNNNSGIDMARLFSGNLVLVFNPTQLEENRQARDAGLPENLAGFTTWGARTPLVIALSEDDGRTWPYSLVLEDAEGVFCYPAVIQDSKGAIHIVYTWDRKAIRHVVVTEEELLSSS